MRFFCNNYKNLPLIFLFTIFSATEIIAIFVGRRSLKFGSSSHGAMRHNRGWPALKTILDSKWSSNIPSLGHIRTGSRWTWCNIEYRIRPSFPRRHFYVYRGEFSWKTPAICRTHCQRCSFLTIKLNVYLRSFFVRSSMNSKSKINSPSTDQRLYPVFFSKKWPFKVLENSESVKISFISMTWSWCLSVSPHLQAFSFNEGINTGDLIIVHCAVVKGDAPLSLQWLFNNKSIEISEDVHISAMGNRISTLTIPAVKGEHAGEYACVADSLAGRVRHSSHLKVNGTKLSISVMSFVILKMQHFSNFENKISQPV